VPLISAVGRGVEPAILSLDSPARLTMHIRPALSIRTKLLAAFGVSLILMLALGIFAITRLGTENSHVNRLASKVVPATQDVGQATALMNKFRKDEMHYILATLPTEPARTAWAATSQVTSAT
jgi:hypothetical protein